MNTKTRRNISKESIACAVNSYPENGWQTRLWCSSFFLSFLLSSVLHLLISKASFFFFISSNFYLSYINFQSYFFLPFSILFSHYFFLILSSTSSFFHLPSFPFSILVSSLSLCSLLTLLIGFLCLLFSQRSLLPILGAFPVS